MIRCNAYMVMDRLTVEWTCDHGPDGTGSHLLIRETVGAVDGPLERLDAILAVAGLMYDQAERDLLHLTDECGW